MALPMAESRQWVAYRREHELGPCPHRACAVRVQADELRKQLAANTAGFDDLIGRLAASQREVADLTAARNAQPAAKTSRWGRSR